MDKESQCLILIVIQIGTAYGDQDQDFELEIHAKRVSTPLLLDHSISS